MNELALFAGAGGVRSAPMFGVDLSVDQRRMCRWKKNTDTAKSANALFAARHSSQEIREASNNAARMPAVEFFKQGKRFALAPSAEKNSCRLVQAMKHAPENVERLFVCRAGSSIQWSMCETGLPSFAVRSLRGACVTRRTERRRSLGILSRNCAPTLKPISRLACHGAITAKEAKNGA